MGFEEYTTPVISDNEITVSKISSQKQSTVWQRITWYAVFKISQY